MSAAAAGGLHTTLLIAARQSQWERRGNPRQPPPPLVDAAYRYSRMEEGAHVATPQDQLARRMADYWKWKFPNIFIMTFTTVLGGLLLAQLFVERFVQHDPELQDEPLLMITLVALNSSFIVLGYLPSLFPQYILLEEAS